MTDSHVICPADRTLPGLTFTQAEVYFILGTSLRTLYQDLLRQPVPSHLQTLLDQLDEKLMALAEASESREG